MARVGLRVFDWWPGQMFSFWWLSLAALVLALALALRPPLCRPAPDTSAATSTVFGVVGNKSRLVGSTVAGARVDKLFDVYHNLWSRTSLPVSRAACISTCGCVPA